MKTIVDRRKMQTLAESASWVTPRCSGSCHLGLLTWPLETMQGDHLRPKNSAGCRLAVLLSVTRISTSQARTTYRMTNKNDSQFTMSTALSIGLSVVGLALAAWPVAVWYEVRKLEKPAYDVLKVVGSKRRAPWDRAPAFEVRQYDPYLLAKVTIEEENMQKALSQGFKKVAAFIFGGNVPQGSDGPEKIPMTSPVVTEVKNDKKGDSIAMTSPVTTQMQDGKYVVAFVMPSKYNKDNLPEPKDKDIQIEEVPGHTYGALSWRGWPRPSEGVVANKRQELAETLKAAGVKVDESADTRLYQYYPPFAPTFIRLQDILLPVELTEKAGKKDE